MEGLSEGVAQLHHAPLAAPAASLHHHAGHLHQLDGALPVLQGLGQIQDLEDGGGEQKGQKLRMKSAVVHNI